MNQKTLLSLTLRGFLFVVLVDLVVIAAVAGIGWWTGWTEEASFQRAIQIAGLLVIGLGLPGLIRKPGSSREPSNRDRPSPPETDRPGQTWNSMLEQVQRYSYTLIMIAAGFVCLMIGWLM